ncbi:hypothetical protein MLD38_040548 [Melastoma candidum]|nr:hypothetical protein MLD38_040548 [Melastoma candidum]
MDHFSFSMCTATATTMTWTTTTTTTTIFSASIALPKGMVRVPVIRRVSSRGMSLRGVETSAISFVKCENPLAGVSLSGQAFGGRCYRGDLWNLSNLERRDQTRPDHP